MKFKIRPFAGICLLILTVALAGCTKTDALTNLANITFFTTYEEEIAADLPFSNNSDTAVAILMPLDNIKLPPYTFATNINQIAADNNTTADKLVSVMADSLIFGVTVPPNLTLDFVKNIKLFISAAGQPEILAAEKNTVPAGVRTVALDIRAGELKPYFQQESISLRIEASLHGIPPSSTKINLRNVVRIVANPLQ